jgi:very-short-patch-repair endonuclease
VATTKKLTQEEFIKKSYLKHNNKFDYNLVNYTNARSKVKIICPYHGEFEQTPKNHLQGYGCIKCGGTFKSTLENFIKRSRIVHNNKYDYSETIYTNKRTKLKIKCPLHGIFLQTPDNHLHSAGCPICKSSKGEIRIREYFLYNDIKFEEQKTFDECYDKIRLRFDFYLPEFNLIIEYDGIQHYKPTSFGSGSNANEKYLYTKRKDLIKEKFCINNGYNIFRIPYWEFDNIFKILEGKLE